MKSKTKSRHQPPAEKPDTTAAELPPTISTATFEHLAGLTSRRLRQLAEAGKFPQPKLDRWETIPCLKGLIHHYRSAGTGITAARTAKLETENRLLLIEEQARNQELINFDEAVDVIFRAHRAMRDTILSWTQHPIELRESLINEIRKAGEFFTTQLVAETNAKHDETKDTTHTEAPAKRLRKSQVRCDAGPAGPASAEAKAMLTTSIG